MKVLELFSGTHSIGKVCKEHGYEVVSVDRDLGAKCPLGTDYESDIHIKEDIMTWDYKKDFKVGEFDLITASPVCLWWSCLRYTHIGRKLKKYDNPFSMKDIEEEILKYGEPMVDKVFEIINYFKPKYWWIENPQSSKMKEYINNLIPYYDVDYCQYGFEYKKRTRIWTNIEGFIPLLCKKKNHKIQIGRGKGGGIRRLERYRIPPILIAELLCHSHS